jgi:hypothetical protein
MKKPYFFNSTNILIGLRFIAKVFVVVIFLMFITLYFSEASSRRSLNPFGLEPKETMLILSFYLTLIGLLIAWKVEGLGGLLVLIGLISFSILYYSLKGAVLWNVWILAIPAVLFLICWYFTNYSSDYDVYRS